jgi:hypothetical protein
LTISAVSPSEHSLEPEIAQLGMPSERVLQELTGGLVRVTRRVEIYEADGVTKWDIPYWDRRLSQGSVSIDRDRDERRTCDFLLVNTDKMLKNDPYNGFWFDKILKAYWGIKYYDYTLKRWRRWETPLGVFMIDRIDFDRFPNAVKVTGRDYTKKCLVSQLPNTLSFPVGTAVEAIIRAVAANAGVKNFALPTTGAAYAKDLVFTRGTDRWKVISQLADTIGFEVFFRADGALTMKPYPDPTLDPIAWSFTQGQNGTLIKYTKSSNDSRIFNHVIVTGATIGGEPDSLGGAVTGSTVSEVIFAEARNIDPGSPTNIDRLGDRVLPYQSDLFTSVSQAQNYADTMMRVASLEEYSMNFESLLVPWLNAGDIVEIRQPEDDEYTPNRFLLSNFTVPLGLGAMSGTARRVTIVGTKQNLEFS